MTPKDYFDLLRIRYEQCLEPNELCVSKTIMAHSIQNARTLELLSKDGHVVMPSMPHENGAPVVRFKRIGRNKATTFHGLCSEHDHDIFRVIDTSDFDPGSSAQLFLFAYRSVLRECHAVIQGAVKLQMACQELVSSGEIRGDISSPEGIRATRYILNAYDSYRYKRKFDESFLASAYDVVEHRILRYEALPPTIATSTLFSLDEIDRPDDVARVSLNIFPDRFGTNVIFSYLREERSFVMQYLGRIFDAAGDYQRYLISKLVIQHCENFVISPVYYEAWSREKRRTVQDSFVRTLFRNDHECESQHIYLF